MVIDGIASKWLKVGGGFEDFHGIFHVMVNKKPADPLVWRV